MKNSPETGQAGGVSTTASEQQFRLMTRRAVIGGLVSLPLLGLGIFKNCTDELKGKSEQKLPIEKKESVDEVAKQFLGTWGLYDKKNKKMREVLSVEPWGPEAGVGPQQEFTVQGDKKMELMLPVKVKGMSIITAFGRIGREKNNGGIYKSQEGEFAIICWIEVADGMIKIRIDQNDLLVKMVAIKATGAKDSTEYRLNRIR